MPSPVVEQFPGIDLAQVDRVAALHDRVDVKYVVSVAGFETVAAALLDTHAVLESGGRRAFGYRTTYFDTAELETYRAHLQQRRRRYKIRSREYVDSGLCAFEVKLKGSRGRTVKHRMDYDPSLRDELSPPALAFLLECVERAYGRRPDSELRPALAVAYTRVTLVAPALGERLTCDFDVVFTAPDGTSGRLNDGTVILESKSIRGGAVAERVLREIGARPEPVCSKYCLGIGFTHADVKRNRLLPLLRRHFGAAPRAAVDLSPSLEGAA
jgi:hypothetical protein